MRCGPPTQAVPGLPCGDSSRHTARLAKQGCSVPLQHLLAKRLDFFLFVDVHSSQKCRIIHLSPPVGTERGHSREGIRLSALGHVILPRQQRTNAFPRHETPLRGAFHWTEFFKGRETVAAPPAHCVCDLTASRVSLCMPSAFPWIPAGAHVIRRWRGGDQPREQPRRRVATHWRTFQRQLRELHSVFPPKPPPHPRRHRCSHPPRCKVSALRPRLRGRDVEDAEETSGATCYGWNGDPPGDVGVLPSVPVSGMNVT